MIFDLRVGESHEFKAKIMAADHTVIAEVYGSRPFAMDGEKIAAMFAAAPDMLAALKATVPVLEAVQRMAIREGWADGHTPGGTLTDQIAAAIAKAEGRS